MRGVHGLLVFLAAAGLIVGLAGPSLAASSNETPHVPPSGIEQANGEASPRPAQSEDPARSPSIAIVAVPVVLVGLAWLGYIFRLIFREPEDGAGTRE